MTPMHRFSRRLLLAAGCLLLGWPAAADNNMEQMQQSTVRIVCKSKTAFSTGSGFVVSTERITYLVTNYHVASCAKANEAEQLFAVLMAKDVVPLVAEWADADKDLVLLRATRALGRPAVRLADTSLVTTGSAVVVVGFPGAADHVVDTDDFAVPTVTRGNIGRIIHSDSSGIRYFQHSAPTNPGNSGGPVFDEAGNVIGVNSLKALINGLSLVDGKVASERVANGEGIAFAIDVAELIPHLKAQGISYAQADGSVVAGTLLAVTAAALLGAGGVVGATPSGRALLRQIRTPVSRRPLTPAGRSRLPVTPAGRSRQVAATGRIRILEGSLAGMEVPVQAGVVLGRDPAHAQLVFPQDDTAVSRVHCDIRFDSTAGLFEVRDLESRNGTFIVSSSQSPRRLAKGAVEKLAPGQNILIGSPRNRVVLDLS
jgi:S1-C subfamily serine protease